MTVTIPLGAAEVVIEHDGEGGVTLTVFDLIERRSTTATLNQDAADRVARALVFNGPPVIRT